MHTPLFTVLLVGVILIVGALTFFPALSLGPILEHLLMQAGKSFLVREEKADNTWQTLANAPFGTPRLYVARSVDALVKLNPRTMMKNPVMFVVEIGSVITSIYLLRDILMHHGALRFDLQITLWLWFTVLFANFAEAMAEGRGKAQADALRRAKSETTAVRFRADGSTEEVAEFGSARGRCCACRCGTHDSGRWRGDRRRCFGG